MVFEDEPGPGRGQDGPSTGAGRIAPKEQCCRGHPVNCLSGSAVLCSRPRSPKGHGRHQGTLPCLSIRRTFRLLLSRHLFEHQGYQNRATSLEQISRCKNHRDCQGARSILYLLGGFRHGEVGRRHTQGRRTPASPPTTTAIATIVANAVAQYKIEIASAIDLYVIRNG